MFLEHYDIHEMTSGVMKVYHDNKWASPVSPFNNHLCSVGVRAGPDSKPRDQYHRVSHHMVVTAHKHNRVEYEITF